MFSIRHFLVSKLLYNVHLHSKRAAATTTTKMKQANMPNGKVDDNGEPRDDNDNFFLLFFLSRSYGREESFALEKKRITPPASGRGMKTFQIIIVSISLNYFAHEIQLKIDDILFHYRKSLCVFGCWVWLFVGSSSKFFGACVCWGLGNFQQFFNLSYELLGLILVGLISLVTQLKCELIHVRHRWRWWQRTKNNFFALSSIPTIYSAPL